MKEKKTAAKTAKTTKPKAAKAAKPRMEVVKKPKSTLPTDTQVKKMITEWVSIGQKSIDLTFTIGDTLTAKKAELGHGNWLPYLTKIGINERTGRRFMKAAANKDAYVKGMSFTDLIGETKTDGSSDTSSASSESAEKAEPVNITDLKQLSKASKSTLIMAIKALKKAVGGQLTEEGKARLLSPEQFDEVVFNIVND